MPLGRALIAIGLVLVAAGLLVTFAGRLPFRFGRLPGDIVIQRRNVTFYFPLMTLIILNALIFVVMWLFRRWR